MPAPATAPALPGGALEAETTLLEQIVTMPQITKATARPGARGGVQLTVSSPKTVFS